jgi:hypothetical protein
MRRWHQLRPSGVSSGTAANLRRDGRLTQLPLVHKGTVLSGNHRVRAAIEAGLAEIEWQELVGDYPPERLLAIQLSHNALSGDDDPSVLEYLYSELPHAEKLYSGISDEMFKADKFDIAALGLGPTHYEEITVTFLPEERAELDGALKRFEAAGKKRETYAARYSDFDRIFDALVKVKAKKQTWNTGLALAVMADLALERLAQLEAEEAVAEASSRARGDGSASEVQAGPAVETQGQP